MSTDSNIDGIVFISQFANSIYIPNIGFGMNLNAQIQNDIDVFLQSLFLASVMKKLGNEKFAEGDAHLWSRGPGAAREEVHAHPLPRARSGLGGVE